MNTETGQLYSPEAMEKWLKEIGASQPPPHIKPIAILPTEQQLREGQIGKYDPCPCGSGNKFKFCCYTGSKHSTKEANP